MTQTQETSSSRLFTVFDFRTVGMIPPNRLIFGCGAIDKIGEEAAKLGERKALLVGDEVIAKLGILERVATKLSSTGFTVDSYTDIEPEPHLETAEALYEFGAGRDTSVIIGVGGGSVMDMAKLAAQCLASRKSPGAYAERKAVPEARGAPLILAPTTSGTGSEVSMNLVLGIGEDKIFLSDPFYYPDIAIIDPALTISMPPVVTANTGIDALSHAIEGMLHEKANPFSDALCLASVEMIGSYLRRAVADGEDLEARYYMSMAATLGMMGMIMSGGLYAHSASYAISKYRPTPHGLGCGLPLPYTMSFNLPVSVPKLAKIAVALGEQTWMLSELDAASLAVRSVARLNKDIGLPLSLQELGGINETDIEDLASLMIKNWPRPMNPRPMGLEESVKLWWNLWRGTY
jgi:alcohol dehydrogenase class IV